jgi:hypothetical protein
MKNGFFLFILSLLSSDCRANELTTTQKQHYSSAITWKANGGRFGDNLLSYARSKWLSHVFNIPILYVPFKYSDELMLHEQENMYTENSDQFFSSTEHLPIQSKYQIIPESNTLYVSYWKTDITIDWDDNVFLKELTKNIYPRFPLYKLTIPKGYISVAAHVRNGGSFEGDHARERERCPLRFVSHEFFIDQIARIADIFKNQKLYVYIFTDHQKPAKLRKKFKKALNNPNITFDCRKENNSHSSNVLEDFFSMMDFDCLIRPASNFSTLVQHLGKNKIAIYPESVRKTADKKSIIDVITIQTRTKVGDRWHTEQITLTKQ